MQRAYQEAMAEAQAEVEEAERSMIDEITDLKLKEQLTEEQRFKSESQATLDEKLERLLNAEEMK